MTLFLVVAEAAHRAAFVRGHFARRLKNTALLAAVGVTLCGCAARPARLAHAGVAGSSNLSVRLYEMYLVETSPRALVAALTITNSSDQELVLAAHDISLWDIAGNNVAAVGEPTPPPRDPRMDPAWLPAARVAAAPLQAALFLITLPVSLPMTIANANRQDGGDTAHWQTRTLYATSELPVWVSFRERNVNFDSLVTLRVTHPRTGEIIDIRLRP